MLFALKTRTFGPENAPIYRSRGAPFRPVLILPLNVPFLLTLHAFRTNHTLVNLPCRNGSYARRNSMGPGDKDPLLGQAAEESHLGQYVTFPADRPTLLGCRETLPGRRAGQDFRTAGVAPRNRGYVLAGQMERILIAAGRISREQKETKVTKNGTVPKDRQVSHDVER